MAEDFNPLVSIVIPVYNGENYMREAIDSALGQTYKNIEVIVVNDGSKDRTDEIAQSYGNKIRYFKKENGGVSTALNLAIKNMKGEYFSWLSHDDVYLPEKIECQIEVLRRLEDKRTVVYGGWKIIDERGTICAEYALDKIYGNEKVSNAIFILTNRLISGCGVLLHKKILEKYNGFDENLRTTQDYDLWFKVFRNGNIAYDGTCNTLSREHKKQVSRTSSIHAAECDTLWIEFFKSLSYDEIKAAYDSELSFYEQMALKFIDEWFYAGAVTYVYEKYQTVYNSTSCNDDKVLIHTLLEKFYNARLQMINMSSLYKQLKQHFHNRPVFLFFLNSAHKIKGLFKK